MLELYSGFFIGNKWHVTWLFGAGRCSLPDGVLENDTARIIKVGEYSDKDIRADIVEVVVNGLVLKTQPNGVPLHITRWCAPGIQAVQSGLRAKANGWTKIQRTELAPARAEFFRIKRREKK